MPKIVKNNTVYAAVPSSANGIAYNGTTSGISANTVQGAIDEVVSEKADRVPAPAEYSSSSTYALGDFCTYDGNTYVCKTAITTAETWNADHWFLCVAQQDYLHSLDPVCNGSFSMNRQVTAYCPIGKFSFAEGYYCGASGDYSHSEGLMTSTSGSGAHSEGIGSNATQSASHAEGGWATALGPYSHAEGYYTKARNKSQHVFGEYNVEDPAGAHVMNRGSYVEIVGNGTANNSRSNARTLDWDGNEVIAGTLTASGLSATTLNGVTIGSSPKFTDTIPVQVYGQENRNFTSSTTLSYTGLSTTCPSGKRMLVRAYFRYVNGAPIQVGAYTSSAGASAYSCIAYADANCGCFTLNFMLTGGETIYYWAKYASATLNRIDEDKVLFG